MISKFILCEIFILLLVLRVYSQTVPDSTQQNTSSEAILEMEVQSADDYEALNPSVIPPSPTAYEITKYGGHDTRLHTGTFDYVIPLVTLTGQNLELPIKMRYSSNGVQVDQISTWVGMSWTLNAGGCITRMVQDKIDSETSPPIPESLETEHNKVKSQYVNNEDIYDSEPDVYSYNFQNYSGKFVHNNSESDNSFVPIPYEKIKIEKRMDTFLITTPDGVEYYFSDIGFSDPYNPCSDFGHFSMTYNVWYLSKIIHPTGEEIDFKYKRKYFYYDSGISESYAKYDNKNCSDCPSAPATFRECAIQIRSSALYLDTIFTEKAIAYFKSTDERLDLDTYKLDTLIIKERQSSEIIKKFLFKYSFSGTGDSQNNYRMFLSSITEASTNGKLLNPYSFYYKNTDILPPRLSKSQDYWGFFNGKNTNTHLCPISDLERNTYLDNETVWDAFPELRNVDREPDLLSVDAGMLNMISFPTYGYMTMDYEPNWSNTLNREAGGVRLKRVTKKNSFSATPIIERYYYDNGSGVNMPKYLSHRYAHVDNDASINSPCNNYNSKQGHCIYYVMSSNSNRTLYNTSGNSVIYETVTKSYGENFENGGEVNRFLIMAQNMTGELINTAERRGNIFENEILDQSPYLNYSDYAGKLIERRILSKGGQTILRLEEYFYNTDNYLLENSMDNRNGKDIIAYNINKCFTYNFVYNLGSGSGVVNSFPPTLSYYCTFEDTQDPGNQCYQESVGNHSVEGISEYDIVKYKIISRWPYLKKKVITQYDQSGNNPIITTTQYFYENDTHAQLTRDSTVNSDNRIYETKYSYPQDYGVSVENFDNLISKNIIAKPIDVRTYNNDRLVSGTQTMYNENGQPTDQLKFESELNDIEVDPQNPYTFTHKNNISYDTEGLPLKVSMDNGINVYYIWAYNKQYPVAKIESNLNPSFSVSVQDSRLSKSDNFPDIQRDVAYLKGLLLNYLSNPNLMVSYYTYKPLVGMTSQTDANGKTTYYEYDDFGRLAFVRDQNGNIVKKHEYHYAGQN